MKKVYIKRDDLFKRLNMVLCNKITEVDNSFIEDNFELFTYDVDDSEVNEEINNLSSIDWSNEEYKPHGITEKMTPEEIEEHLKEFYFDTIKEEIEANNHMIEPYQYFIIDGSEWVIDRLKDYGVELGYSEALDVHVLPIYDYGTSWSMFSYSKEVEDDYQLAHDETLERKTCY